MTVSTVQLYAIPHPPSLLCVQIRHYESDEKSNALRKEFLALEREYASLKKDETSLQEELDIASMDPREAHTKFAARVSEFKAGAKHMDERAAQVSSMLCVYTVLWGC